MPEGRPAARKSRPGKRRPLWLRLLRLGCRLGFLFFAVLALALVGLPHITDSRPARAAVCKAISRVLNGADVRLETLRADPVDAELLVLEGLQIAPPGHPQEPVLSLGRVECRWNPLALKRRKVEVTLVSVRDVTVRAVERGGEWNFAPLVPKFPPAEPKPPRGPLDLATMRLPGSVTLGDVSIDGVRAELDSEQFGRLSIGPVSARVDLRLERDMKGRVDVRYRLDGLSARAESPVQSALDLAVEDGRLTIKLDGTNEIAWHAGLAVKRLRATVAETDMALPQAAEIAADGLVDLAGPRLPMLKVRVDVPGLLTDTAILSAEVDGGWRIGLFNDAAIDLMGLDAPLRNAIEQLPALPQLAVPLDVRSVHTRGMVRFTTFLDARAKLTPSLALRASVTNVLKTEGVALGAEVHMPSADDARWAAVPVDAEAMAQWLPLRVDGAVEGVDAFWQHTAQIAVDTEITIGSEYTFGLTTPLLRAAAHELGAVELRSLTIEGGGPGDIRLPRVDTPVVAVALRKAPPAIDVALSAKAGLEALRVSSPVFGAVDLPLNVEIELVGTDLADPQLSDISLQKLTGSIGAIVPAFTAKAVVHGYGAEGMALRAGGTVDLGAALALKEHLIEELKALVQGLAAKGRATGSVTISGALPKKEGDPGLKVVADGGADLSSVAFAMDDLVASVEGVKGAFALDLALPAGYLPREVDWAAEGELGPVDVAAAGAVIGLGGAQAEASGSIALDFERALPVARVSMDCQAQADGAAAALPSSPGSEAVELGPLDARAVGRMQADLVNGNLVLQADEVAIPGLLTLTDASLQASGFGVSGLRAKATFDVPDLASARALVPADLAGKLPRMAGSASGKAEVVGKLPGIGPIVKALRDRMPPQELVAKLISSLRTGEPWTELRLLPLRQFYRDAAPLTITTGGSVRGLAVEHEINDELSVGLEGLSADLAMELKDGDLTAAGSVAIPAIRATPMPAPLEDTKISGQVRLTDFDRLVVEDARFSTLKGVVSADASLVEISGLSAVRPGVSPATMLAALNVSAFGKAELKPEAISALKGWAGSGKAGGDFALSYVGGESLELGGVLQLKDLSVSAADLFALEGLSARVPIAKKWEIVTGSASIRGERLTETVSGGASGESPDAQSSAQRNLLWMLRDPAPAVGRLLDPEDDVTIRSISLLGTKIVEDLGVKIQVEPEGVRVPRAHLNVLGGLVVGRTAGWLEDGSVRIFAEGEFDRLDLRRMLPAGLRGFRGDAGISGTLQGELAFRALRTARMAKGAAPRDPLKDMNAWFYVTHIGPKALRHALLVVDPKEENPALARLREGLSVVGPKRVRARVRGGFVDADVELQGLASSLVSSYPVPRFNIAEAFRSERAGQYFDLFGRITDMAALPIEALASDRMVIGAEGDLVQFVR